MSEKTVTPARINGTEYLFVVAEDTDDIHTKDTYYATLTGAISAMHRLADQDIFATMWTIGYPDIITNELFRCDTLRCEEDGS